MTDGPLRIVSYNVRYFGHALRGIASTGGAKRRIARAIAALEPAPDVICLQEVETVSLRSTMAHRRAHDDETQLEAFMARLEEAWGEHRGPFPYEALYFRAHSYRLGATPLYTTGLAVIANVRRLRIDAHNAASPEAITHHHVARMRDGKQSRICAHVRLCDAGGRAFHVFNTHLSLPTPFAKGFWQQRDKMGYGVNQVAEARSLAAFVARHAGDEPFVVCGDFNSAPASDVYRYLRREARFEGAQECLGALSQRDPRAHPTAGFAALRMHLDHLFSGGALRWLDLAGTACFGDPTSPFHGLSDHVPLVGRFELVG